MIKKRNNNSFGFTLLELIIVVVIVGVLAGLAMPRMSIMIERARGTEAIVTMTQIRSGMERCYVMSRDFRTCVQVVPGRYFEKIGLADPDKNVNSHFTYGFRADVDRYWVYAARNSYELLQSFDGGNAFCFDVPGSVGPTESQIALCQTPEKVWIIGEGIYAGIGGMPP